MDGVGGRVDGVGCRVDGAGCWVDGTGCRVNGVGCRVQGAGCRVDGGVPCLMKKVQSGMPGFNPAGPPVATATAYPPWLRVEGSGFRV